jgi:hypothetical protein
MSTYQEPEVAILVVDDEGVRHWEIQTRDGPQLLDGDIILDPNTFALGTRVTTEEPLEHP